MEGCEGTVTISSSWSFKMIQKTCGILQRPRVQLLLSPEGKTSSKKQKRLWNPVTYRSAGDLLEPLVTEADSDLILQMIKTSAMNGSLNFTSFFVQNKL